MDCTHMPVSHRQQHTADLPAFYLDNVLVDLETILAMVSPLGVEIGKSQGRFQIT